MFIVNLHTFISETRNTMSKLSQTRVWIHDICKRYNKLASDCVYTVISLICLELATIKYPDVLMKIIVMLKLILFNCSGLQSSYSASPTVSV